MTLSEELRKYLKDLSESSRELEEEEQEILIMIIREIAALVSDHDGNRLRKIFDTVSKASKPSSLSRPSNESLRRLRNSLVHQGRAAISYAQLRRYSSMLWDLLEASASEWDRVRLYNILSYCIGPISIEIDPRSAEAAAIIEAHKAAYKRLDASGQERCFRELVIRLYSDPESRSILKKSEV